MLRLGVDLAGGLLHLHARGCLHCDLRPANVLLDGERGWQRPTSPPPTTTATLAPPPACLRAPESGRAKLGGFSLARRFSEVPNTMQRLTPKERQQQQVGRVGQRGRRVCTARLLPGPPHASSCPPCASLQGPLPYLAPELLRAPGLHTTSSDLWALGALLFEAACGHPPFAAATPAELARSIAGAPVHVPPGVCEV